jgi:hypothetical protein
MLGPARLGGNRALTRFAMSKERFVERQAGTIYRNIVRDYAPLLHTMAERIQALAWE